MKQDEHDTLNESAINIHPYIAQNAMSQAVPFANPPQNASQPPQRVRHIYLQEQNVYGRFAPFLLLKDQLHSQIDSSGNTALHHMCSHNSPYLPLYLSTLKNGDPILNRQSNMGHTPLDVAGLYCRREYVQLLKQKGAVDDGKVDHWAIQGGNLANWSGHVDITKKHLIHWAAYNDLPQVLRQFAKQGATMDQTDTNGNTPIDLAVINKSYQSVKVLAELGYTPKKDVLLKNQSRSIARIFAERDQSSSIKKQKKILKLLTIPLFIIFNYFLFSEPSILPVTIIALILYLSLILCSVRKESEFAQRKTAFQSQLISKEVNYQSNHLLYTLLIAVCVLLGVFTMLACEINGYFDAFLFWIDFAITMTFLVNFCILFYGISVNLTYPQMMYSHLFPQFWTKIDYIPQRNMLTRIYRNLNDKGFKNNWKQYLGI